MATCRESSTVCRGIRNEEQRNLERADLERPRRPLRVRRSASTPHRKLSQQELIDLQYEFMWCG